MAGAIDSRSRSQDQLEAITSSATDPYATIRSDFLQSREAMIRGEEAAPVLPPLDDPAPAAAPGAGQSPSAAASPPPAAFASADAVATAPALAAPSGVAAGADPADLAMATAQPCDRDPAAATRLAGL